MLLGQFSVTFEYHLGAQHAHADGMSRLCGQCLRPDCPVSSSDTRVLEVDSTTVLLDQSFVSSETLLEGLTAVLPTVASDLDLILASRQDATLTTAHEWVQSGATPPWSECSGLSPELRCWRLQFGNLSVDMDGRLWPLNSWYPVGSVRI